MNVTINFEEFNNFTGWGSTHTLSKSPQERVHKLRRMGMQDIIVKGEERNQHLTLPSL